MPDVNSDWPFTILLKRRLGRVQLDHNSKMAAKKFFLPIFHSNISAENFGLLFKAFHLFRKFPGWSSKNGLTIYIVTDIWNSVVKSMTDNPSNIADKFTEQ